MVVEGFEDIIDFFSGVGLVYLACSQLEEGIEGQSSGVGGIEIVDKIVNEFIGRSES